MRVPMAWLGGAACILALVAAGSQTAGAANPSVVCGPSGAPTLKADAVARVYSSQGNVYGCAAAGRRSYRLGATSNSFNEGRAGPVALAGGNVGYGLTDYGVDTVTAEVMVRHLGDGRVLRTHAAITGASGAEYFERVDDIVVKRDGSVAWIADDTSVPSGHETAIEVAKSDRGRRMLLDKEASGIKLHSLHLAGSRLTWRYESTTRSARLR